MAGRAKMSGEAFVFKRCDLPSRFDLWRYYKPKVQRGRCHACLHYEASDICSRNRSGRVRQCVRSVTGRRFWAWIAVGRRARQGNMATLELARPMRLGRLLLSLCLGWVRLFLSFRRSSLRVLRAPASVPVLDLWISALPRRLESAAHTGAAHRGSRAVLARRNRLHSRAHFIKRRLARALARSRRPHFM